METTRRKRTARKEDLTTFGRWVDALNIIFKSSQAELALLTGLSKSLFSRTTRVPGEEMEDEEEQVAGPNKRRRPSPEAVEKLLAVYQGFVLDRADRLPVDLPVGWQQSFRLHSVYPDIQSAGVEDLILGTVELYAVMSQRYDEMEERLRGLESSVRLLMASRQPNASPSRLEGGRS